MPRGTKIRRFSVPCFADCGTRGSYYSLGDASWSMDANIYERLKEKEQTMIDAIDRGILECGSVDADDLKAVFKGLFDVGEKVGE